MARLGRIASAVLALVAFGSAVAAYDEQAPVWGATQPPTPLPHVLANPVRRGRIRLPMPLFLFGSGPLACDESAASPPRGAPSLVARRFVRTRLRPRDPSRARPGMSARRLCPPLPVRTTRDLTTVQTADGTSTARRTFSFSLLPRPLRCCSRGRVPPLGPSPRRASQATRLR